MAWILGSIYILLCSAIIIIYGVNFDLAQEYEADQDGIFSNNTYNYNSNETNGSETFIEYNVELTDQIEYNLSSEYALIESDTTIDTDDIWTDIDDPESLILSFLLTFLISVILWKSLSTVIFTLLKFLCYKYLFLHIIPRLTSL